MKTSIYIPDDKEALFERAKKELGNSISATFVRCLERELELKKAQTERIVIEVKDEHARLSRKAFEGRWLIGNESEGERHEFSENSGVKLIGEHEGYSVAVTKKGQLVVMQHRRDEDYPTDFHILPSIEDMEKAADSSGYPCYPSSLCSAIRAELYQESPLEELDI